MIDGLIYADTSVFGGPFDDEFAEPSIRFFEQVRDGSISLATSALVEAEIAAAPDRVRHLFEEMIPRSVVLDISSSVLGLRRRYMDAGIVSSASENDALHVAVAVVAGCRAIVSWNFKHIVHLNRIESYNLESRNAGYESIGIITPQQVIDYEEQDL